MQTTGIAYKIKHKVNKKNNYFYESQQTKK